MEAETSRDLQSVHGDPGEPMCSSSTKAGHHVVLEKPMFPSSGGKSQCPSSKAARQEDSPLAHGRASLFVPCRSLVDWMPTPHGGERSALFSQMTQMSDSREYPHRHNHNIVWSSVWVPCSPVRLIYEITHHSVQKLSINIIIFTF